jgi:hypothetical protein
MIINTKHIQQLQGARTFFKNLVFAQLVKKLLQFYRMWKLPHKISGFNLLMKIKLWYYPYTQEMQAVCFLPNTEKYILGYKLSQPRIQEYDSS